MRTTEAGLRSRIVKALGGAALAAALSATMIGQADAAAAPAARAAAGVHTSPQIGGGGVNAPKTFWLWGCNT